MRIGAIEAGGTKFVLAVGNENGEIYRRHAIPTEEPEKTMEGIRDFFREEPVEAVGVGCFGPIDLLKGSPGYGSVTTTPKVKWRNFNIVESLKAFLDVPIGFDTDVNGAALGEAFFGSCVGLDSCLYITVGTGIGAGAILEGKLIHGMLHPEMGHIFLKRHKEDTYGGICPYHGDCFEGLVSGPALEARTGLKGNDIPDDHDVFAMAAWYIAQALVNYIMVLSPKRIVIGGGVMHRAFMFDQVRSHVKALLNGYILTKELEDLESYIVPPGLGDNAGIVGALALGLDAFSEAKGHVRVR